MLAGFQHLPALPEFRPAAAGAHLRRHFRLRRQRPVRHLVLRGAAHLPDAAGRPRCAARLPVLGLPVLHRHGGAQLRAGLFAQPGILRARVAHHALAGDRLGAVCRRVHRHAVQAQRAAHLRRQLVLPGLHPHRRRAGAGQQRRRADLAVRRQGLRGLFRRAERHGAVVVRPQRGGLLPHRRLPGHDVLLHPQAGRPAGVFLPAFGGAFLVADLHVYVGRAAPPALYRAAGLDADARHGVFDHAVDALLGRHDQRADDAVRCLGQAAHRPGAALLGDRRRLLRHVHLRRPADGGARGQLAVALHGLDGRPRAFRRAGLGGLRQLRRDLLHGAGAVEAQRPVFRQAGGLALLGGHAGHRLLHQRDVGGGHHAGPDVARL